MYQLRFEIYIKLTLNWLQLKNPLNEALTPEVSGYLTKVQGFTKKS